MHYFDILSVNISEKKGVQKKPVAEIELQENCGIAGDAHAGNWHRQVSLLAREDIDSIRNKGFVIEYGDFAENITTQGIELAELPIGTRLYLGNAIIEVTQIGKECHAHCAIYEQAGECVMPLKGIFAKVIKGGIVRPEMVCYCEL